MPIDLVLIRHAESEGNVASKWSRRGDHSAYTTKFRQRHSSQWRLTDRGVEQAQQAGIWVRENLGTNFDRYYVSEYIRAKETAVHLGFPNAEWFSDLYLRERDWGDLDVMPEDERHVKYGVALAKRKQDAFYWCPPNGESMASLCLRIDRVLDTLHRECGGKKVVIVCHGEVMWAFRVRLERMAQARYRELDLSTNPLNRIHNCQILQYSRIDPSSGDEAPYLGWMRSVCPFDPSLSTNEWEQIVRTRYSNTALLELVEQYPRLIKGGE